MNPPPVATREIAREERFNVVWTQELNDVFADVAPYYDRANYIASLGLWGWFLRKFMETVDIRPGERVLDVCAGTNAIGIALLKREPTLEVHAIDRSAKMQEVGRRNAEALGFRIHSVIDDVHTLPYPDNSFDVATLQFASRHLRIRQVASEIRRVLKPGGRFYHCDMLRPGNPTVEKLYYAYLRFCLWFTGFLFRSGPAALNCKEYFIQALQMFYSAQELSDMLEDVGYRDVTAKTVFAGMLGFHRAVKPQ
ncbi:MAG: class I SAM-dependent methyltransferase [Betaproteobacteria bacterium]|jgi:demethylmenaquinone methyltransferase/2-methoxy-6-polyprenyl-1,4-benzoquinol methylase|nr:class I SAM-dependent methyltransferase [Betaproteobacteria bacterium]